MPTIIVGLSLAVGMQIAALHDWHDAITPLFVGGFIIHVANAIAAYYRIPTKKDSE